jgi:Ca2+/Na+ antiporter
LLLMSMFLTQTASQLQTCLFLMSTADPPVRPIVCCITAQRRVIHISLKKKKYFFFFFFFFFFFILFSIAMWLLMGIIFTVILLCIILLLVCISIIRKRKNKQHHHPNHSPHSYHDVLMHDFDDGLTPKPGQKVVIIANAANCNRQVLFSVQDKGENILQAQVKLFFFSFF